MAGARARRIGVNQGGERGRGTVATPPAISPAPGQGVPYAAVRGAAYAPRSALKQRKSFSATLNGSEEITEAA